MFISYATNTSSDVVSKIKVSGSSEEVVGLFSVRYIGGSRSEVPVVLKLNAPARNNDALLVEVQLLRKNALKDVDKSGTCDLVILENVLYSSDPSLNDNNYFTSSGVKLTNAADDGDVFVVDKAESVSMDHLSLLAGEGNLQLELAALNASDGLYVATGLAGNISVFATELSADIDASVGELKGAPTGSSCIDAKTTVNVTLFDKSPETLILYPGKTGGVTFPCVKRDLPARVPVGDDPAKASASSSSTPAPTKAVGTSAASGLKPALVTIVAVAATLLLMATM